MLMDAVGGVVASAKQTAPQVNPLEVRLFGFIGCGIAACITLQVDVSRRQWQLTQFPTCSMHAIAAGGYVQHSYSH
jgi:hypothetical protein